MAIRLKRWIACVAILAVLGTVAGTYIFHALKDDPPPQDDDLMFVRTKVPAAENGFRFVSQFAAKEGSEVQFTGKEDDEEDDRKHKILCLMGGEGDEKV